VLGPSEGGLGGQDAPDGFPASGRNAYPSRANAFFADVLQTSFQSANHILKRALIQWSKLSSRCLYEAHNFGRIGSDIWSPYEAIYLTLNY